MGAEVAIWLVTGITALAAGVVAQRRPSARLIGRVAVAVLFLVGGALVNTVYLWRGVDYGTFADGSYLAFVHTTWREVVAPNQPVWIGLLVAFEAVVGVLVASGGRRVLVGYGAALLFHVLLLPFGWFFYAWAIPMIVALALLLHAELTTGPRGGPTGAAATERPGVEVPFV